MKNITILFLTLILFSCGKDNDDPGPNGDSYVLTFTLNEVEYIKPGNVPGEVAYYGKYGEDDMEQFVVHIGGALNHDATVSFILATDQTGNTLHYNASNIDHLHSFSLVFEAPGTPEGTIYYADNDVTVSITEKTLPTTSDNGRIKGTFSGTFNLHIDNVPQEGEETFISGSFNIGY